MAATNIPAAKPSLAVKFPFVTEEGKEFSDLEKLLTDLGQQSGGYYLLGANNCWHGGIHITDEKFAHHKKKHPVRCMMDGTVIAYRLNKNYPTQKWQAKSTQSGTDLKFSNGFCLVRHEYESPTNPLTFYSLYMHLADYNTYAPDSANTEKTIAITKNTNARNTANISRVIGVLNRGSTLKVDTQQQPYQAAANGQQHDYYKGTIESKATGSDDSIAVGDSVYLYSGCFPAGTFAPIKKPALPSYWKSRVIGKSKERMRVYRTEQACKNRTTPHDALLNEQQTVTFDAAQVKSATIKGKSLKIALCKIDNAATFAHDTRLNEGWMIVDESQVSWEKVEPTEFDRIVKCNFPIEAGDPVGFMGIWESPADPIGAGTTKTKYQMHVELFTIDDKAALDKFLNNEARLTTGKKYLKVPKGSKLYSSDGHGGFVNPHELLNAARDYVFEESACTQVKDPAGTVFYNIKGIHTGEAAIGPIDTAHVKIEGGIKLVTQHDWKELGFTTLEETNNDADGYINPEKIPSPMFKDIFNRVDCINSRNGQGDGTLTGKEIKDALQQDKDLRNDLYKMIAGHPSEWHSTTQNNMKKLFEEIKAKNTEEEYKNATQFEIDRFLKCEFASQIEGLTQKLWHFHPVVTVCNIMVNSDCYSIFRKICKVIFINEGGYVDDPSDKGGKTNKGIAWATWTAFAQIDLGVEPTVTNLKNITNEQAEVIYYKRYWKPKNFCKIENQKTALMIYDFTVTSYNAIKILKKKINQEYSKSLVVNRAMDEEFIHTINDIDDQNKLIQILANAREEYYLSLTYDEDGERNEQVRYINGWNKRVERCLEIIL